MPKKSSVRDHDRKPIQEHDPAIAHKENTDSLVELAAEQFADLLWKCWLVSSSHKTARKPKSNARTGEREEFPYNWFLADGEPTTLELDVALYFSMMKEHILHHYHR